MCLMIWQMHQYFLRKSYLKDIFLVIYRVSHNDMIKSKWLWGVERLRILMIHHLWLHGHKGNSFVFHQPVFKKIASAGLNSLRQKGCQILVKNWIFDDPFHKKGPLLVILGPGMIQPSGSVILLMKWGCWGHYLVIFLE